MTEIAADILSELNSIIDTYGDTITIYGISSDAYSTYYHDRTPTYDSGTAGKGIAIRTSMDLIKEGEGEIQRNRSIRMYIKAGVTIDNNYKITHNSIDYLVTHVETIIIEDTELYFIVELTRIDST